MTNDLESLSIKSIVYRRLQAVNEIIAHVRCIVHRSLHMRLRWEGSEKFNAGCTFKVSLCKGSGSESHWFGSTGATPFDFALRGVQGVHRSELHPLRATGLELLRTVCKSCLVRGEIDPPPNHT